MKRKNKGFTLIELLAVIVILGLLMAIAIPSVTKYITQSRKKTVSTTIDNYMGALTNQVNDMEYTFTEANTIYAVPIECIALERGGTNPFGEWHQASDAYWAYVLIQYDDKTSSYTYGFTFKDSAGYGLYPTTSEKLNESGSQINTDLDLTRPTNGTIANITEKGNWNGFKLDDDTSLVVLEATSEGEKGDGKTTCTLCQKGGNYNEVEMEKEERYKIGREICFDHNECFNIISSTENTVTLLASEKITPILENPIQNSSAANSVFSSSRYWCFGTGVSGLKKQYGTSYPVFVYDENASIYQYVEAYEIYLRNSFGLKSINASIISREQLVNDLKCSSISGGCTVSPYSNWLIKSYTWHTGTAIGGDYYSLVKVSSAGFPNSGQNFKAGIRPIITIEKSEMNSKKKV